MEADMPGAAEGPNLQRISPDDADFHKALDEVGMPRGDLTASKGVYFAFVDLSDMPLGYCGYELWGDALALIRSCVVPRPYRGKGVGRAMMGALIGMLAAERMKDLYLLTMDADPFFAKFGFEAVARDTAPEAIRMAPQFSMDCCDDAILMRRVL